MIKLISARNLVIINFGIVAYFILIVFVDFYKINYVFIGFFRELLTIPFLLAQAVFVLIGITLLIKRKSNFLTIISVTALAICTFFTISSFF
jgi:hypothetical protein